jgi:FkbM family methyltransferase
MTLVQFPKSRIDLSGRLEEFRIFAALAMKYRTLSPREVRTVSEKRYMQRPPELVRTRFGFSMFLNPIDRGVSAVVGGLGCWEPRVTHVFRRLLREAHVVVDVGANIGWYSLLAARSGASVYAFEPEPVNFGYLQRSIEVNGFKNVHAFPYAVWNHDGEAYLTVADSDNKGIHSMVRDVGKQKVKVTSRKLDSLLSDQVIDILKLDAEEAEPEVLLGAQQLIQRGRIKNILMEFTAHVWKGRDWLLTPFQIFSIKKDNLLLVRR